MHRDQISTGFFVIRQVFLKVLSQSILLVVCSLILDIVKSYTISSTVHCQAFVLCLLRDPLWLNHWFRNEFDVLFLLLGQHWIWSMHLLYFGFNLLYLCPQLVLVHLLVLFHFLEVAFFLRIFILAHEVLHDWSDLNSNLFQSCNVGLFLMQEMI